MVFCVVEFGFDGLVFDGGGEGCCGGEVESWIDGNLELDD